MEKFFQSIFVIACTLVLFYLTVSTIIPKVIIISAPPGTTIKLLLLKSDATDYNQCSGVKLALSTSKFCLGYVIKYVSPL
jgi:hypothetical protein